MRLPPPALLLLTLACGGKVECGPGTEEVDGACVPVEDDGAGGDGAADSGAAEGGDEGATDGGEEGGEEGGATDSGGADGAGDGGGEGGGTEGGDGGEPTATVCDDGVAPYADLQEAADAAADGDTITLCPGRWGPLEVEDRSLALVGLEGAELTFLVSEDGTALTAEDSSLSLEGLTISGRSRSDPPAMVLIDSQLEVRSSRVAENEVEGTLWVPAIAQTGSDSTWTEVIWEDNAVSEVVLMATEGGSVTMTHSICRDNGPSLSAGMGGGCLLLYGVDGEIHNNIFAENQIQQSVGIWALNGISAYNILATQNVIWGNSSNSQQIALIGPGALAQNNIVSENTSPHYTLVVSEGTGGYNNAWGNSTDDHWPEGGTTGDMSADPMFEDPAGGDFHLSALSPCIDAGNPAAAWDDADGSPSDMGAYGGPGGEW